MNSNLCFNSLYPKIILIFFRVLQPCMPSKNDQNITYKLDFHTSYNQFYLSSDQCSSLTNEPANWIEEGYHERLFILKNMLVIFTGSYGHIKGELHIEDKPDNKIKYDKYDHIVEGGLEVRSGILQIFDCPNSKVQFQVKLTPGIYRVRVYSSNLVNTDIDEDEGNDHYKIELWPDKNIKRTVLKQYTHK
jgi:hypothetical protein